MTGIEELKKLPNEEKLRVMDDLWENMREPGNENIEDIYYNEALIQLLDERLAAHRAGEIRSYDWKEVRERMNAIRQTIDIP